jgi:SAM-dependent methyltransferase
MRPYTRSLHPNDYQFLPHAPAIRAFQMLMASHEVPHHISHEHKVWENASIMQQLEDLDVRHDARLLDVGSGGLFFPPYVAQRYPDLTLTDSADIRPIVDAQCAAYGVEMPFYQLRAEDMSVLPSDHWDVVMCISTIEHIASGHHDAALREICRLTKPGGLMFITSDYFRSVNGSYDRRQYRESPFRHCQETPYHKELVLRLPELMGASFVGDTDLEYAGDFVHNYSFVNICLRKVA